jgi:hypothetical protein
LPKSDAKGVEIIEEPKLATDRNVKSPTPATATSAATEVGKLKQKLKLEKIEREKMKKTIEELQVCC